MLYVDQNLVILDILYLQQKKDCIFCFTNTYVFPFKNLTLLTAFLRRVIFKFHLLTASLGNLEL